MRKVFSFLETLPEPNDTTPLESRIDESLQNHRGHGVVILLSDFLISGNLKRSFNAMFSSGLEIQALQLLSPSETNPDLTSDFRLVDMESDTTLDVSASSDLLQFCEQHRATYKAELTALCQSRSGRFLATNTETAL